MLKTNNIKKGDLVKILYDSRYGNLGIIIKQGRHTGETPTRYLVHLADGRNVWLWADEIINV